MKKLAVILLLLAVNINVFGQTEKGNRAVGSTLGGLFITQGTTIFAITPEYGVFIEDNLEAGIWLPFIVADGSVAFIAGPFLRNYFGKGNVKPYMNLSFLGTYVGGKGYSGSFNAGYKGGAGIATFINSNVSINSEVNIIGGFQTGNTPTGQIDVGLQLFFSRKNKK